MKSALEEEPTIVFMKSKRGRVMSASHISPGVNSLIKFTDGLKQSFEELESGQGKFNKLSEAVELKDSERMSPSDL